MIFKPTSLRFPPILLKGSPRLMLLLWEQRCLYKLERAHIPDQLWLGVHVAHAVLGKPLVQAVKGGSKKASYNPHQNEEAQVHSCPEVAFLIRLRALCRKVYKKTLQ